MSRWWPAVVAAGVVAVSVPVLLHWFGGIADDLRARERLVFRREAAATRRETSLEVWSAELEVVDVDGVRRARDKAAAVLLERALGPAPLQVDGVAE